MLFLIRSLILFILFLAVAYLGLWGTLALWFKMPGPVFLNGAMSAAFAVIGLGTLVALFTRARFKWLLVFTLSLAALLTWWNSLIPPTDANWSPDVAQQTVGTIDGDVLTLNNVRAFEWRSADDFDEIWDTRSYDLSQIETADLFMSYWAGDHMAHLMVSFGFADGQQLAWSIEVRRAVGGSFSPVADYFKANPIAVIASDERDVVGVRSNIRKERVQLFRIKSTPDARRKLLEAYVDAANAVAEKPQWFNSVWTNCSRSVVQLARGVGIEVPMDYRVLVNGYFPEYLHERGAMSDGFTIEEMYELGDITERALSVGLTDGFSAAIRDGVPKP